MPRDVHVEWGWHQPHSLKHLFQSQMVVEDQVRQVLVPSISNVLTPQMLSTVTLSIQIWPCHHPWSLGSGPKQYEKISTWICDRSWQGQGSYQARSVLLERANPEWLGSWQDQHAPHARGQYIQVIESVSCQMNTSPSWHIIGVVEECWGLVEYATSVPPNFYWKWECCLDIWPQMNWWMDATGYPSFSWKLLVH